jgi:hypothetical protein
MYWPCLIRAWFTRGKAPSGWDDMVVEGYGVVGFGELEVEVEERAHFGALIGSLVVTQREILLVTEQLSSTHFHFARTKELTTHNTTQRLPLSVISDNEDNSNISCLRSN